MLFNEQVFPLQQNVSSSSELVESDFDDISELNSHRNHEESSENSCEIDDVIESPSSGIADTIVPSRIVEGTLESISPDHSSSDSMPTSQPIKAPRE